MSIEYKRVGTSYYHILVGGEVKGRVFKASIGFRNYTNWRYLFNGTDDSEGTLKEVKVRIQELVK